jgi:DNA repair protein RadC
MQEQNYSIKQWAKDDRPREKLLSKGAEALSNSELLALLIHEGTPNSSAVDLAKEILKLGKNNLNELAKLSIKDLMAVKGIGVAKAVTVTAALELGRRRQASVSLEKAVITSSKDMAAYLQNVLGDYKQEVFAVIFLNRANKINHLQIMSKGGLTGTVVDPRVILKKALEEDAVSLILSHNHPSGNLTPSRADQQVTQQIKEAAKFFDIKLLDHIIVSDMGYYSFADEGML